MPTDLKASIRKALAGSSSQQPVSTAALYKHGTREQVEAALMELYQAHETYCCKTIKGKHESVVWWLVGGGSQPHSYRKSKTGVA